MAYGLEVIKDGVSTVKIGRKGYCLIDQFKLDAGVSTTKYYTSWSDWTIKGIGTKVDYYGGHDISVSGTTVTCNAVSLPSEFPVQESASFIQIYAR